MYLMASPNPYMWLLDAVKIFVTRISISIGLVLMDHSLMDGKVAMFRLKTEEF